MAPPPSWALGGHKDPKAKGITPWGKFGPRAPGRLAASHYAKSSGSLSSSWDWAAASLTMTAPNTLLRAPMHGEGQDLHAPNTKPAPPQPFASQATGFVRLCGDTQIHIPPVTAAPEMDPRRASKDEEAMSSEIGNACPVEPPPIIRVRIPKNSCEGYRGKGPPSPRNASDTATHE